jgi:FHS family L-fucose permease-like MFS transporter
MIQTKVAARDSAAGQTPGLPSASRALVVLVIALFFIWGGITSLNDILIPKLKSLFQLTYTEAMLTQFAFFTGYFVFSIPAGMLVARMGYLRGIVVGLTVMAAGCLLFIPATASGVYAMFLLALFVVAAGITILQVAANPLITLLGDPKGAHSRLTFAQAFNSLGTTIMPYLGAQLILGSVAAVDPSAAQRAGQPRRS